MATVQKSKKKKISCIIIAVVVIALIAVLVKAALSAVSSISLTNDSYPYGEAAVKDLSTYVNISGNVSSSSTVNVTSEVLAKVAQLNVKVGDSVTGEIYNYTDKGAFLFSKERYIVFMTEA